MDTETHDPLDIGMYQARPKAPPPPHACASRWTARRTTRWTLACTRRAPRPHPHLTHALRGGHRDARPAGHRHVPGAPQGPTPTSRMRFEVDTETHDPLDIGMYQARPKAPPPPHACASRWTPRRTTRWTSACTRRAPRPHPHLTHALRGGHRDARPAGHRHVPGAPQGPTPTSRMRFEVDTETHDPLDIGMYQARPKAPPPPHACASRWTPRRTTRWTSACTRRAPRPHPHLTHALRCGHRDARPAGHRHVPGAPQGPTPPHAL